MGLPILYKYSSIENGLRSIQNQKFKWSSINEFNDPFESRFTTSRDLKTVVRIAALTATIKGGFKLPSELDITKLDDSQAAILREFIALEGTINSTLANNNKKPPRDVFFELERNILDHAKSSENIQRVYLNSIDFSRLAYSSVERQSRILCLSKSFNHPLMWGHYTKNHRGIMFELDLNKIPSYTNLFKGVKKIKYQKKYPSMCFNTLLGFNGDLFEKQKENFYQALTSIKQAEWSYEQEYRSICHKDSLDEKGLFQLPKECIKSITLGCNSTEENIELAKEYVKSNIPMTRIYKNRLDEGKYQLIRVKL